MRQRKRRAWLRLAADDPRLGVCYARAQSPFGDDLWTPWNGGETGSGGGNHNILWIILWIIAICGIVGEIVEIFGR